MEIKTLYTVFSDKLSANTLSLNRAYFSQWPIHYSKFCVESHLAIYAEQQIKSIQNRNSFDWMVSTPSAPVPRLPECNSLQVLITINWMLNSFSKLSITLWVSLIYEETKWASLCYSIDFFLLWHFPSLSGGEETFYLLLHKITYSLSKKGNAPVHTLSLLWKQEIWGNCLLPKMSPGIIPI